MYPSISEENVPAVAAIQHISLDLLPGAINKMDGNTWSFPRPEDDGCLADSVS